MPLWLTAIVVFILIILIEVFATLDFYAAVDGAYWKSALYTGLCASLGDLLIVLYVANNWLIIPDVAGAMVGAFVAVKWFRKAKYSLLFDALSNNSKLRFDFHFSKGPGNNPNANVIQ